MRAERVHSSGLLNDGSSTSALSCRVLVRVAFTFDQSSIDTALGSWTSSSSTALPSSSSSSSSTSSHPLLSGDGGEEVKWREASLDSTVSFGVRWGPMADPIAGLSLTAVWPFSPQSTWTESADYSDLDPLHAPEWRLKAHWLEDSAGDRTEGMGGLEGLAQSPYVASLHSLMEVEQRAKQLQSLSEVLGLEGSTAVPSLHSAQQQRSADGGAVFRGASASPPPLPSSSSPSSSSPSSSSSSSSRPSPTPSSSALSAIKAVHSSLAAHIESAQLSALYGETPTSDYVDGIMKALMDITEEESVKKSSTPSGEGRGEEGGAGERRGGGHSNDHRLSSLDPPRALCPYGSLLSLLVVHLCRLHLRGWLNVRSVAVLWMEFVNECRYHFEAGLDLPHLSAGEVPDYRTCVLHQKLQSLQRCIGLQRQRRDYERRKAEGEEDIHMGEEEAPSDPLDDTTEALTEGWQDFEELKRDPNAEGAGAEEEDGKKPPPQSSALSRTTQGGAVQEEEEGCGDPPSNSVPRGVLHQLRDERLLLVDRPLLVPISQPCEYPTADELELEVEMLARLDDAAQADDIRREKAEMQLTSDMAAFKAANPGCCIEDFVRWHSPKDWRKTSQHPPLTRSTPTAPSPTTAKGEDEVGISLPTDPSHSSLASAMTAESTEVVGGGLTAALSDRRRDPRRGELSVRMRHRNNRWQTLWKVALFDPSSVGERVLNDLEHVDPSVLLSQLLGVGVGNFLSSMARTPPAQHNIADVRQRIAALHPLIPQPTTSLSLSHSLHSPPPSHLSVSDLQQLCRVELLCSRATSLLYCFPLSLSLIDRLLVDGGAQVKGLEEREAVLSVFAVVDREMAGGGGGGGPTPPISGGRRLPKVDRRSYTLFAPSPVIPQVGDRLHLHIREDRESLTQPSSYAPPTAPMTATAAPTTGTASRPTVSASSSRPLHLPRFRHLRGGGRFHRRPYNGGHSHQSLEVKSSAEVKGGYH